MAGGSEVGIGYVTLVATAPGLVSGIQKEMAGVAGVAASSGKAAGAGMGASLLGAFKKAMPVIAVAAAVKGLYEVGQVFEEMKNTIIKGTGASGAALEGLQKSATNVASKTGASFKNVGTVVSDLNTRLGITGKPLEDLSLKMLKFAKVTGTDVAGDVRVVTRMFGDWSIKTGDQTLAMDKLLWASQHTGIGVQTLADDVTQFGSPLRMMGFTMEQSMAMFARFEKEGVNTGTVLAGLKMGLKSFAKAGEEPIDALKRAQEAIKNAGTTAEANSIAFKVFGVRAGPDMAAAIREGRFDLDSLITGMKGAAGAVDDTAKSTRTLGSAFSLLKNKALVELEPVAMRVIEGITKGVLWFVDVGVPAIQRFAQSFAFLGPIFETVSKAFKTDGIQGALDAIGPAIEAALPIIGAKLVDLGKKFVEWIAPYIPPLLVELGKVLLAVGVWIITVALPAIGAQLLEWGKAFVAWVSPYIPPLLVALGDLLTKVGVWLWNVGLPALVAKLEEWGGAFVAWVGPKIGPLLAALGDLLTKLGKWMWNVALPAIGAQLLEWGAAFVDWVGPKIGPLLVELGKLLTKLGDWAYTVALPAVIKKLTEWGLAFVAWVAPRIPPLLIELGKLLLGVTVWILTVALPAILNKLLDWGWAFVKWVAPRVPGLLLELGKLQGKILGWIWDAALALGKKMLDLGVSILVEMLKGLEKKAVDVLQWFKDLPGKIIAKFVEFGSTIKDALVKPFEDAWKTIKEVWGWITGLVGTSSTARPDTNAALYPGGKLPSGGLEPYPTKDSILGHSGLDSSGDMPGGNAASGGGLTSLARSIQSLVFGMFRGATDMGGYNYRYIAGTKTLSDHSFGKAFDVGGSFNTMQGIANMLAGALGKSVKYLIFNHQINTGGGWRQYFGQNPHTDHVHVSTYLSGGPVPGYGPQPAMLHGGEYVLTKGDTSLMRGLTAAVATGSIGNSTALATSINGVAGATQSLGSRMVGAVNGAVSIVATVVQPVLTLGSGMMAAVDGAVSTVDAVVQPILTLGGQMKKAVTDAAAVTASVGLALGDNMKKAVTDNAAIAAAWADYYSRYPDAPGAPQLAAVIGGSVADAVAPLIGAAATDFSATHGYDLGPLIASDGSVWSSEAAKNTWESIGLPSWIAQRDKDYAASHEGAAYPAELAALMAGINQSGPKYGPDPHPAASLEYQLSLKAKANGTLTVETLTPLIDEVKGLREEFRRQNDRYLTLARTGALA